MSKLSPLSAVLLCATILAASSSVFADMVNPFAPMAGYNVMVFGDYVQSGPGDTEGFLAVQGNMTTGNNYGVGHYGQRTDPAATALVVGGTLNTTGAWKVFNGNAYYGNSTSENPISYDDGYGQRVYELSVNFEQAYNQMHGYSQALGAMTETASFVQQWGGSYIEAGHGTQVVNINLDDLFHSGDSSNFGWGLNITGHSDTQLLVNILGGENYDDLTLSGGYQLFGGIAAENIIFNFIDVDTFTMQNASIAGNILAVDTDLILEAGNIEGYSAFGNITTLSGGEFHNKFMFGGEFDLPTIPDGPDPPSSVTPEPASMGIVGIGLLSLALLRRRRQAAASKA